MTSATPTRRERRRSETTAEIKEVALRLMAESGPGAITLRAIARDMGMTPNAVYSYFPTRDDLVTALIAEVYGDLVDTVEAARDVHPQDAPAARIMAWATAFRDWVITNKEGFLLIYGDPVPGYRAPEGGPAPEALHRACTGLVGLIAGAWPTAEPLYADEPFGWNDFDPTLATVARQEFPALPPTAIALALRTWGRMHGLVALEVLGHLRTQTTNPANLYRTEMNHLVRELGLTPPP
ncbi:TetR/AcrR family transcriptional regulator [Nocardia sp. IFM 10818]